MKYKVNSSNSPDSANCRYDDLPRYEKQTEFKAKAKQQYGGIND